MSKTRKEIIKELNKIAKKDTKWIKEAKWRINNWWWRKYFVRIHLKYLRVKRRIINFL